MRRNARDMVNLAALGALTGLVLVPVINQKTRKRLTRSTRNVYFRMADFVQDLKDMTSR